MNNNPFINDKKEVSETVPLHTLTHGKFKYPETGNVETILKRDDTSITLRRADGWLVTVCVGDWGWEKGVVKV